MQTNIDPYQNQTHKTRIIQLIYDLILHLLKVKMRMEYGGIPRQGGDAFRRRTITTTMDDAFSPEWYISFLRDEDKSVLGSIQREKNRDFQRKNTCMTPRTLLVCTSPKLLQIGFTFGHIILREVFHSHGRSLFF